MPDFDFSKYATPDRQPTAGERKAEGEVEKTQADTRRINVGVARDAATTPTSVQTNQAPAGYMWKDPQNPEKGVKPIPGFSKTDKSGQEAERRARIKASLEAVHRIRSLAGKTLATGSASEFFQSTPVINQNRRNLEAAINNASAGIIADMMEALAAANPAGVSGMFNTEVEARRMGAQIADLNPNQDLPSLLQQAQLAEDYYLRQAAQVEGRDVIDQDLLSRYLPEARLEELLATDKTAKQLSTDGTETLEIPDWYQQAHFRYLNENKDNLDPSQYAAFRADLDEKAGLTPDINAYVDFAKGAQDFFREGGAPQQLGIVPAPTREISQFRQGVTDFAQTPFGAGTLSAITSATAGIPTALAGGQEKMEAVRQNQPIPSFIGDVVGGALGVKGLGTATKFSKFGDGITGNPVLQDAAFNVISGATQAEDPLIGASVGLVGSLAGEAAGRTLGRMAPDTFARSSMREARESVPTSGELGLQADALYRQAAAKGQKIDKLDVNAFIGDTKKLLRDNGFLDSKNNILGTGPVQDAYRLLLSFRGRSITPAEAQTIRNKMAEGRMAMRDGAPDNTARMFSGQLTKQFDTFAEAAMPGIAEAREVAQRRIIGREMERTRELGQARGASSPAPGSEAAATKRAFGALDTAEVRGAKMYPQDVEDAIRVVSRGTPSRNISEGVDRLLSADRGGGAGSLKGLAAGYGLGTLFDSTVTGGLLTGGIYGTGALGRTLNRNLTRRDAELAELIARGGPQFKAMLDNAVKEAATQGGRIGSGAFGAAAIRPFLDEDFRSYDAPAQAVSIDDMVARYAQSPAAPAPPAEEGFTNVDVAGNEVAPPEQTTRVINGRVTDIDPVTQQRVYVDTGEPVENTAMKLGGMVRKYQEGGAVKGYMDGGSVYGEADPEGFNRAVADYYASLRGMQPSEEVVSGLAAKYGVGTPTNFDEILDFHQRFGTLNPTVAINQGGAEPTQEEPNQFGAGLLRSIGSGLTFAHNDEIEAALLAALERTRGGDFSDTYRNEVDRIRAEQAAYEAAHPTTAFIGEMGGGLATAAIPGMQGVSAARLAAMSPARRLVYEGALSAGQGALYGAGAAEDIQGIPESMATEGVKGAAFYGGLRGGISGAKALRNRRRDRKGQQPKRQNLSAR